MSLGRNLKTIIDREDCSIRWISKKSGVSQTTITRIIRGDISSKLDNLYYIFNAMGYDLYLVAPDGRKQKYVSISEWIRFVMKVQNITTVKETRKVLGCGENILRRYLSDSVCPLAHYFQSIINPAGYSIKLVKGDIEYDLFEPINIW
jgi:transcriptional regulator with XRE-family HTH domain